MEGQKCGSIFLKSAQRPRKNRRREKPGDIGKKRKKQLTVILKA